jgi:hypothetical protein
MKVKVQLELSDKANEIVSIYKIKNNLRTKAEAINRVLESSEVL